MIWFLKLLSSDTVVIKAFIDSLVLRFSLRIEQEIIVLRYIFFCKPSIKTLSVFSLRIMILFAIFHLANAVQVAFHVVPSPFLNFTMLSLFMLLVVKALWEFGLTVKHVKRFSFILLMLLGLQLSLIISINDADPTGKLLGFGGGFTRFNVQHAHSGDVSIQAQKLKKSANLKASSRKESSLVILNASYAPFSNFVPDDADLDNALIATDEDEDLFIEPKLVGKALCYPNPFRLGQGTSLGYELSKNMDMEIRIYDMRANQVFLGHFPAGTIGGLSGYNRLTIDSSTFNSDYMYAGIYFYVVMFEGKVVDKGKMAVIP